MPKSTQTPLQTSAHALGDSPVLCEVRGHTGCITLNRPSALNALSLEMVRILKAQLVAWRDDPKVQAVAIRGSHKEGYFGHFCAGGDIRFLHQAALAKSTAVDDFFTEEYQLNYLIHRYPKPYIAFMDGVVMGGGMGLVQGASLRLVTERTKMAMPETIIGFFPDVAGGYFLSRCPAEVGEYLGLTGNTMGAKQAVAWGLADVELPAAQLEPLWQWLGQPDFDPHAPLQNWIKQDRSALFFAADIDTSDSSVFPQTQHFSHASVPAIMRALEADSGNAWAQQTAATLRTRSPLMLHVTLAQIRRSRQMTLSQNLQMERALAHHCFYLRPGQSETLEGIRALVVDKDKKPRWQPSTIEAVTPEMVAPFFNSPWSAATHPLRHLVD